MQAIVGIVGESNSGKTTLIEKLLFVLKKRGYKVATIKYDTHGFEMDHPGKDTWRHAKAGADCVIISSSAKVAMIKKTDQEKTLDELVALCDDVDLVIVETFKDVVIPKIEIVRADKSHSPTCELDELVAIATDIKLDLLGVPIVDMNDAETLVNIIEEEVLA